MPKGKDLFYEGGKYLKRALLHHGEKEVPDIRCAIDARERELLGGSNAKYSTYANSRDMDYKEHITNILTYEADKQPLTELLHEKTSLGVPSNDDEILICYLCCVIAENVPCYLNRKNTSYENVGVVCDYSGQQYMEDMFLKALHSITIYGVDTDD